MPIAIDGSALVALFEEQSELFHILVKAVGLDPGSDFIHRDLRMMNFEGADLTGFDLSSSDLRGTSLRGATRLDGARLDGAVLDSEDRKWLSIRGLHSAGRSSAEPTRARGQDTRADKAPSIQEPSKKGPLTKLALIGLVGERVELTHAKATEVVNAVFEAIENALMRGEDVRLVGFGTFEARRRPKSTGINPRTGEHLTIPEKTTVVFRPGKRLKSAVNPR